MSPQMVYRGFPLRYSWLLAGRGFRGSGDAGPQHLVVTRFQEYQDGNPLWSISDETQARSHIISSLVVGLVECDPWMTNASSPRGARRANHRNKEPDMTITATALTRAAGAAASRRWRDQDKGDQRDRHPPGRPSPPGGASCRVDGHMAPAGSNPAGSSPAGSSCELTGLGTVRAARARWSRHSEWPRPTRATPVGMAKSLKLTCGSSGIARVVTAPTARSAAAHRARMRARKSAMPKMRPPAR